MTVIPFGKNDKPIFESTLDAQTISQSLLEKSAPGDIISYEAISKLIGRDIITYRYILHTARAICKRERGFVFAAVQGVGLKHLLDGELVDASSVAIARHHRAAQRESVNLSKVKDFAALSEEQKTRHNVNMTILRMEHELTQKRTAKTLTATLKTQPSALSIEEALKKTLEHFK